MAVDIRAWCNRIGRTLKSLLPSWVRGLYASVNDAIRRTRSQRLLSKADRLHLGCGGYIIPGWANVDISGPPGVILLDLTKAIPAPDSQVRFVFTEHFIEHIPRVAAAKLLVECHRVMILGGVIRISTPDLRKLLAEYAAGRTDEWADGGWMPDTPCRMVNEGMRLWGHEFVYDQQELTALLEEAGFRNVRPVVWRKSEYSELSDLEIRPFHDDLILEATK